jgi:hypothetical protein
MEDRTMSEKDRDTLKKALYQAEISDVELEDVAGGNCTSSCQEGCSQCCSPGNAERGGSGGGGLDQQSYP